jgi:hypothetical protein
MTGAFSFEFLLFENCPSTKLKNGFRFFFKFTIGIKSLILSRDNFFDQKEFKRKMAGALIKPRILRYLSSLKLNSLEGAT